MIIEPPKTSHAPALRALWKEAFGDTDDFLDLFFTTAFSKERCLVACDDNTLCAALYWFDVAEGDRKLAYIYAVATLKSQRGRGICRSLMRAAHVRLHALGYSGAILVPGEASLFDFYGRLGYALCSTVSEISRSAIDIHQNTVPSLTRITAKEYGELRRRFLPADGIIQEGECLAFLEGQATLYKGDNFILAARAEGKCLRGLELLGNTDAAPAVLSALGFAHGSFRVPGKDIPFAMYYHLDGTPLKSCYFGLAFD